MAQRNTMQRQIIHQVIHKMGNHPTAEQVYRQVQKQYPNISKATVYRNMAQMARVGHLKNAGNFSGATHYDHKCHNHYHFVCSKCGKIHDVDIYIKDLDATLPVLDGFDIQGYTLSFDGVCKDCNSKRGRN